MKARLAIGLLLLNWAAFFAFINFRPSERTWLAQRDLEYEQGSLFLSSSSPWTYIADRPLYNWNEWHGGESRWVKLIEITNLPALAAACIVTELIGRDERVSFYRGRSWVRAWSFAVFATLQWIVIGAIAGWRRDQ